MRENFIFLGDHFLLLASKARSYSAHFFLENHARKNIIGASGRHCISNAVSFEIEVVGNRRHPSSQIQSA
ncbi:MAG: hypothetical protein DKT66_25700 [Candidatus Melainabacteria bacterium]|nr:MAG: hypothetical protein DKT66_25700 [Candidatus Melainabacteria bacterium]